MRLNKVVWVLIVMLVVAAGMVSACGGAAPISTEPSEDSKPAATPEPAEPTESSTEPVEEEEPTMAPASADGEILLQERCATCHSLGRVEQTQKSREEWERTVARMVGKGAEVNEDEQAVMIEYLVEVYGP